MNNFIESRKRHAVLSKLLRKRSKRLSSKIDLGKQYVEGEGGSEHLYPYGTWLPLANEYRH